MSNRATLPNRHTDRAPNSDDDYSQNAGAQRLCTDLGTVRSACPASNSKSEPQSTVGERYTLGGVIGLHDARPLHDTRPDPHPSGRSARPSRLVTEQDRS